MLFFYCWDLQTGQTTSTATPQVIIQDNRDMLLVLGARTGREWKIHFSHSFVFCFQFQIKCLLIVFEM